MFDGREIIPLIENKINPDNWNSTIGSKPVIGFKTWDIDKIDHANTPEDVLIKLKGHLSHV